MTVEPEGYKYSDSELLGPLVRDFHEMVGHDLSDAELLALDFALEWTKETVINDYEKNLKTEWAVMYGFPPTVRFLEVPNETIAKMIAPAVKGQVRYKKTTGWEKY